MSWKSYLERGGKTNKIMKRGETQIWWTCGSLGFLISGCVMVILSNEKEVALALLYTLTCLWLSLSVLATRIIGMLKEDRLEREKIRRKK